MNKSESGFLYLIIVLAILIIFAINIKQHEEIKMLNCRIEKLETAPIERFIYKIKPKIKKPIFGFLPKEGISND